MPIKKLAVFALFTCVTASEVFSGTLTSYSVGDVLICFRKSSLSGNDLVVDAGSIATFTNTTVNQHIPITAFNSTQLGLVGINAMDFSAFSWFDDTVSPVSAQWTLFASRGRVTPYAKTSAYASSGASVQQLTVNNMQPVVFGAHDAATFNVNNTATAVIEPDDTTASPNTLYTTGTSYDSAVNGNSGNADFDGTFAGGNIEKLTYSGFNLGTNKTTIARSDFYWIPPSGSGAVKYLGYFELSTNGSMTFVAQPTTPTITTLAATGINDTNAQPNATVNPNSDNTTMYFQYGLTSTYGGTSGTNYIGTTSGTYGLAISNLTASTVYHYRAVAYNSVGTNFGSDLTFTTTGSVPLVAPVITGFGRTNGVSYVSFTTGASGTYTLRGTNSVGLSAARTNWPAIASLGGNGLTNTLQDTTSDSLKYYQITAQ